MPGIIATSPSDSNYMIQCNLDGSQYQLVFRYSAREACYYVDLYAAQGALLVAGRKVVCNTSLFTPFRYNRQVPQGALVCVPVEGSTAGGSDEPPGIGELGPVGCRCVLVYYNQSEVPPHL